MRLCVVKQGSTPLGVSVIFIVAFKEEASVIYVQSNMEKFTKRYRKQNFCRHCVMNWNIGVKTDVKSIS